VTDRGTQRPEFGVETIHLDLAALAGSLGQRLRDADVPVTPERSAEFARALALVRPDSRRRLYWTARSVFVSDRAQGKAFDTVFRSIFGDPVAPGPVEPDGVESVPAPHDARPRSDRAGTPSMTTDVDRPAAVEMSPTGAGDDTSDAAEADVPLAMASDEEVLAGKSFDALTPQELAQLYRLMSRLELATPLRRTRRYEHGCRGERIDLRRTVRASLRTGGDPLRLARRRRRTVPRRVVTLCDISGSMEPYARAYLQFVACAAGTGPHAEAFVFATRLTRITRWLSARNPELAIQRAAAAAPDWSSGTRIGDALKEFNDRHGRRGMARGAVVVILSDGWERGDPMLVGREMERLARLAHRIVWVNPRAGARGFSVEAGGMRAALAHCDSLVSGHNLEALGEVAEAIGAAARDPGVTPAAALGAPAVTDDEPWASATPVAGSSVAMPSGYGPSRGNTTPGWGSDDDA
jgi:hypothetical protein